MTKDLRKYTPENSSSETADVNSESQGYVSSEVEPREHSTYQNEVNTETDNLLARWQVEKRLGPYSRDEVYKLCVGPAYHRFYGSFNKFSSTGSLGLSFSIPAFFLGSVWFVYRRMYLWAFLIFMCTTPASALGEFGPFIFALLVGAFAKGFYWQSIEKKITNTMRANPQSSAQEIMTMLKVKSGPNFWGAAIFLIVFIVPIGLAVIWYFTTQMPIAELNQMELN